MRRAAAALVFALAALPVPATGQAPGGPPRVQALACVPHSFPQRTQRSFAVDPTDDRILYVGVEQEGFFKSVDGGATWLRADAGLKAWARNDGSGLPCFEEFYETVINAKSPAQLCIARAGGPGLLSSPTSAGTNGVYCSNDGAATWTQRVGPSMNTAAVTLAIDPTDFNTMYVGVNGGPCSNPPPVCASGTYFNTRGSIYKTTDGGATWRELDALYISDLRVVALRIDEANPNVSVAGTFAKLPAGGPGNFGEAPQRGVLRSTDGGRTWSASLRGMSADPREQALLELAVAPRNALRVYATASSNAGYWSADGGVTLTRTARMNVATFDPHDAAGLHLLGATDDSITESRDGGRTWQTKARLPGEYARERGLPTHMVWSRIDARHVFLSGPRATVFESRDGGATWRQILSADRLPR